MIISVSVSVTDMLVLIYRYRQKYRLGEYICIGIGIGCTSHADGGPRSPSMHVRYIGISKRDIGIGHISIGICIGYSGYRLYRYRPNIG
jgi:hypothetical protein